MDMKEVMPVGTRIQLVPGSEWYAMQHEEVLGFRVQHVYYPGVKWDVQVSDYYYCFKHIMPYDG